jgi:hypothetical protein
MWQPSNWEDAVDDLKTCTTAAAAGLLNSASLSLKFASKGTGNGGLTYVSDCFVCWWNGGWHCGVAGLAG